MLRKTPIKRGRGKGPDASEKRHWNRIAAMGCLVCRGPATIHHVTARVEGGRIARSHRLVTPLCALHHQVIFGPRESVEALGHGGFFRAYGIDLLAEAERLWAESERKEAA